MSILLDGPWFVFCGTYRYLKPLRVTSLTHSLEELEVGAIFKEPPQGEMCILGPTPGLFAVLIVRRRGSFKTCAQQSKNLTHWQARALTREAGAPLLSHACMYTIVPSSK